MTEIGPVGRLGYWMAGHVRLVVIAWLVVAAGLGALAPRAEHALSGAGWEASGSESVSARDRIDRAFGGQSGYALTVVVSGGGNLQPAVAGATKILGADGRIASISAPKVSADGNTIVLRAGAAARPTVMVQAADDLKGKLADLSGNGVSVSLTGAPGMWSDFNEANKKAMMKSELYSWPVTMAILVLAFGSLVAAGLPLLLTILGLMASAGTLFLAAQAFDVSIWSMNFALMFALALGIDYALFVVARFRGAHFGSQLTTREAVAVTMDTAGKAVLFSGVTVLISLSAVMLVPSPAFRSMSLGIMLSVLFVLAAALTLLPALLARLGDRVDALALKWVHAGEHRSPAFARWAELLWRRPWLFGTASVAVLVALALPALGMRTALPGPESLPKSFAVVEAYDRLTAAFPQDGSTVDVVVEAPASAAAAVESALDTGFAAALATGKVVGDAPAVKASTDGRVHVLSLAVPVQESDPRLGPAVDAIRADVVPQVRAALAGTDGVAVHVGGMAASTDLTRWLDQRLPWVVGFVLVLTLVVMTLSFGSPSLALATVVLNALSVGAAYGVITLVFQNTWAEQLLGFTSIGSIAAWLPLLMFVVLFGLSMDYHVFVVSRVREAWASGVGPRDAVRLGVARSAGVVTSAAAVMVAVFAVFGTLSTLEMKQLGVGLATAVLLDATVVRGVLLPAVLALLGRRAHTGPRWLPVLHH